MKDCEGCGNHGEVWEVYGIFFCIECAVDVFQETVKDLAHELNHTAETLKEMQVQADMGTVKETEEVITLAAKYM